MNDTSQKPNKTTLPPWHIPEQLIGYFLTVILFVVMGPFETYTMDLATRALYWTLCIGAGWVISVTFILTSERLPVFANWQPILRIVFAIAMAAIPIFLLVVQIDKIINPNSDIPLSPTMFMNVGVVVILISSVIIMRIKPRMIKPAPVPDRCTFLDRLPPTLGSALISISSFDHYIEVTTAKGKDLIYMRLSDALEELANYPGQQVHRSHWMSAHAFSGTSRVKGRLMAHLVDGRELPVSRSFGPQVRRMAPVQITPKAVKAD